jgi:hypothetical protein
MRNHHPEIDQRVLLLNHHHLPELDQRVFHRPTCVQMEEEFLLSKVVLAVASAVHRLACVEKEEEFPPSKVALAATSVVGRFALLD